MNATSKAYRPTDSLIGKLVSDLDAHARLGGTIIGAMRTILDAGGQPAEFMPRVMRGLHKLHPNDQNLTSRTQLGVRWATAVEALRRALAETDKILVLKGKCRLADYSCPYSVAPRPPAAAKSLAAPKGEKKPSAAQKAAQVGVSLPYAASLSTAKLKAAAAGVMDPVSMILLAARLVEAATGSPAAFQLVLNEFTVQTPGHKRTMGALDSAALQGLQKAVAEYKSTVTAPTATKRRKVK